MPKLNLGTFELHYARTGSAGEPVVLVHDYWGDGRQWEGVVARLSSTARVLTYDRRGHGESSAPSGSVALADQVSDLSTLLSIAGRSAHHVVGTGVGGVIALQLALLHPDQVRSVNVHEPSLLGLLAGAPAHSRVYEEARVRERSLLRHLRNGDAATAAGEFVEHTASDPGSWSSVPPEIQASFVSNAQTTLSELVDPTTESMDTSPFLNYREPVVVTSGKRSAPVFADITDRLCESFYRAMRYSYDRTGHFPHLTDPDQFVQVVRELVRFAASRSPPD